MKKIKYIAVALLSLFFTLQSKAEETQYITSNVLTVAGGNFGNADDAVSGFLPIGFTFRYGGVDYTQVRMSTNGILYFTAAGSSEYTNEALSARTTQIGVYALWDDLYVGPSGNENLSRALYHTAGTEGNRVFIMQWTNWYSYAEPYEVGTFNIVLYEGSNKIDIYYRNMLGASVQRGYGASSTIGLVVNNGYFSQYSMNATVATEGKLLTYTPAAGGNTPYTLSEQMVTAATAAAIQTYFLSASTSPKIADNLSASPSTPNATSATLEWDLSDLGVEPTSYVIRYATNPAMSGLLSTASFTSAERTHVLTSLVPGTTYYWQVVSSVGSLSSVSTISTFTQVANTAPVATGGSFTTQMNTAYVGQLSATDADNVPNTSGLIYSISTAAGSGQVTLTNSATGAFTYTPANGFSGTTSFGFKAFDGTAYSNEAFYDITVGGSPEIALEEAGINLLTGSTRAFGIRLDTAGGVSATLTIKNTGNGPLSLSSLSIVSGHMADFSVNTTGTLLTLPADAQTTFTVTFDPTSDGAKSATLRLVNTDADEGNFDILLTGTGVTIPDITTQPLAQNIEVYDALTLSVAATGTPALSYQWRLNGTPIPAATSATYTVSRSNILHGGSYTCVVTNAYGSDTSAPAAVSVTPSNLLSTNDSLASVTAASAVYRPVSGVISPTGRIAVNVLARIGPGGIVAGNDQMILTDMSGSLQVLGREGRVFPTGVNGRLFYNLNATAAGSVVYRAPLTGVLAPRDQAYFISPDGISLDIIQEGDAAPIAGTTLSRHTSVPVVTEDGTLYFDDLLLGVGVLANNNSAVFYDDGSSIQILAREGTRAPTGLAVADQSWYGEILAGSLSASRDQVAFIANLQADPLNTRLNKTDAARNSAIFVGGKNHAVRAVARKGSLVAGLPIRAFNAVAMAPDGACAYVANLTVGGSVTAANSLALFHQPAVGAAVLIAQKDQMLPGAGTITVFNRLFCASGNQVIFEVTLAATKESDNAICRWTPETGIEVLVQEGDSAPGGGLYGSVRGLSVSPIGNVFVQDTRAIWRDTGDGMQVVVQTGDTVQHNGLPRLVRGLTVPDATTNARHCGGGQGALINDDGTALAILSLGGTDYTLRLYP